MAVAKLAWLQLGEEDRRAVSAILRAHPHYTEYLSAGHPPEVPEEEWAFMRAAYWCDWVRSNYSETYNQPTWHYIEIRFAPRKTAATMAAFETPTPNVVTQITACGEKIAEGAAAERAVNLCWLLHLIGDIHQPLHCATLWSDLFPDGDRGGNLSLVRVNGGEPIRLHQLWDGLLGAELSVAEIDATVNELADLVRKCPEPMKTDLEQHSRPADWAREGHEAAKVHAYVNGDLSPAHAEKMPPEEAILSLSEGYLSSAKEVAKVAAAKAGRRLASAVSRSIR